MKQLILNLANKNDSDFDYNVLQFPDGQQDIVIGSVNSGVWLEDGGRNCLVLIKSRLSDFRDLELIICATNALRNLDYERIALYIPYLLGARSDRQFVTGGNSYLVQVVAPIINSLNFEFVKCLDVHSNVAPACINRLKIDSNINFVRWALMELGLKDNEFTLVSPDAGAKEKMYNVAKALPYNGEIVICSKQRDIPTGKIISTEVPLKTDMYKKDFVIIDDICDGGRTFIEIAKIIKRNEFSDSKIYLIVTHGIFSAGLSELDQYFDGIFCTNSYTDISNESITQLNVFN